MWGTAACLRRTVIAPPQSTSIKAPPDPLHQKHVSPIDRYIINTRVNPGTTSWWQLQELDTLQQPMCCLWYPHTQITDRYIYYTCTCMPSNYVHHIRLIACPLYGYRRNRYIGPPVYDFNELLPILLLDPGQEVSSMGFVWFHINANSCTVSHYVKCQKRISDCITV